MMPPPSVPPPDGDVDRGRKVNIVMWTLYAIAMLLLLARVLTRTRLIRSWGWDDTFACLAMATGTVNSVLLSISIHFGTGRHRYYLGANEIPANKYNWLSAGFHIMATNWGKLSVAFFLMRVLDQAKKQKIYFYGGMILLTIINSIAVYTIYRQCTPTAKLWDYMGVEGTCWHPHIGRNYAYFQSAMSAFTDFLLAVYPIFIIRKTQMELKMKIGLGFLLSLGILAMMTVIGKMVYVEKRAIQEDATWHTPVLIVWAVSEQYLIVIAACIPALSPMVKHLSRKTNFSFNAFSKPSCTRSRSTDASKYGRNRLNSEMGSQTGMTVLTATEPQIYPLSEYKGWVGPNGTRHESGSQEAIISTESTLPGGIMKTMEVYVNSQRDGSQSESGSSLPGDSISPV